jgi:hypothetical protein
MSQQLTVFDGVGLAVVPEVVGEADAVVLVGVGLADALAGAELGVCCGVEDLLGDGEAERDGLAEALVALAEVTTSDAETVTVNPAPLTEDVLLAPAATTLPAGDPAPPALPYTRNTTTAMPAKPPVSISPIPRRFSSRREARGRLASAFRSLSSFSCFSSLKETPRRPPPADLVSLALLVASASETTESRGLSECRARPASGCAPVTRSPSYGSLSGTGRRPCVLAGRPGPLTDGICTVERPFCTLDSSSPVAPQPGQETAPFRCLRQVLQ